VAVRAEVLIGGERLQVTTPAPREAWSEVLRSDPFALTTQSPGWVESMCALGGYEDASRLYEREDGRRLVLPLCRRRGLGGARLAVQSSFGESWGMGGLLAPDGVTRDDVTAVLADLVARPALRTLIRPNPLLADAWQAAARPPVLELPRLAHVLDLAGGYEEVWSKRFSKSGRANVRKAERAGLVVEHGSGEEHVATFHRLLRTSIDRWAERQHEPLWMAHLRGHFRDPERKFQVLARTLGDAFSIWSALLDGRPVAALVVLRGTNAHATRLAMDVDTAGPSRASYLLHARAIQDACEAGCRHYHFGESGSSAQLAFFKTRFGAEAYPYAEYRLERLPLTAGDRLVRTAVKRAIRFTDAD
jgi:hypothetical protein